MNIKKIIIIALSPVILIGVLFGIYFFNLDMKFTAYVLEPFLLKHYDKIPRKQYV